MSQRTAAQNFLLRRILQPVWRLQRSLTLGAQGVVIDEQGRVLMVRHTYRPGWCFPGGGVEKGETVHVALTRELQEECGVIIDAPPELFGVYSNETHFPGDHVVLFVVRHWHRSHIPAPNNEIADQNFFAPSPIQSDWPDATKRRLDEIFNAAPRAQTW